MAAAWGTPRAVPTISGAGAFQPLAPALSGGTPSPQTPLGLLQPGGTPDGEPAGQVRLPLQVVADDPFDLELQRIVPALAVQRREGVERAPLVQVDQAQPALLVVSEGDQGTQQLRAEAGLDQ